MEQEHERAAGAWHAEWAPLRALLVATGSAAAWLRTCLEGLEVDAERMRANLGGADAAAAVASAAALVDRALAPGRGRDATDVNGSGWGGGVPRTSHAARRAAK